MPIPHGHIDITVKNKVITAVFIGSINYETLCGYSKRIKEFIKQFNNESFALLIDDMALEGATPEAYEELQLLNTWVNTQRLVAKAFVIESNINKEIILQRTPALSAQNIKFFKTHTEATQWLEQYLAV